MLTSRHRRNVNRWSRGQHFKALNVQQIGDRYDDKDDNDLVKVLRSTNIPTPIIVYPCHSVTKSLGHSCFRHSEYCSILYVLEDVTQTQPADMCKGGKAISMARRLPVGSPN